MQCHYRGKEGVCLSLIPPLLLTSLAFKVYDIQLYIYIYMHAYKYISLFSYVYVWIYVYVYKHTQTPDDFKMWLWLSLCYLYSLHFRGSTPCWTVNFFYIFTLLIVLLFYQTLIWGDFTHCQSSHLNLSGYAVIDHCTLFNVPLADNSEVKEETWH